MMSLIDAFSYLAFWSLIGAALFSLFVIFVFRSGIVYTSRKEDGNLKKNIPLTGYITMAAFLLTIVGFFVLANYFSLVRNDISIGFFALLPLNYGLYLILFLFDTFFIDFFVLVYWRPNFLQLSNKISRESIREHISKSIPVGLGFGILIAGLVTTITILAFIR